MGGGGAGSRNPEEGEAARQGDQDTGDDRFLAGFGLIRARTSFPNSAGPVCERIASYSLFWGGTISSLECGTPEWIRTTDLLLRRQTLYPTELRAHMKTKDLLDPAF